MQISFILKALIGAIGIYAVKQKHCISIGCATQYNRQSG
jgi:hypothetical protein